jgi:hypothetical protein
MQSSSKKAFFKIILNYNFKNIFLKKKESEHLELLKESVNFILARLCYPHNLSRQNDTKLALISSSKKKGITILVETEIVLLNEKSTKNIKDFHINPDFVKSVKLVKAYNPNNSVSTVGPDIK